MLKNIKFLLLATALSAISDLRASGKVNSSQIKDKKTESTLKSAALDATGSQLIDAPAIQKAQKPLLSIIQQPREIQNIVEDYVGGDFQSKYEPLKPITISPIDLNHLILAYHPAGTKLAAVSKTWKDASKEVGSSDEQTINIINLETEKVLSTLKINAPRGTLHGCEGTEDACISLAFLPNEILGLGMSISSLIILDLKTFVYKTLPTPRNSIYTIALSPDQKFVLIADGNWGIRLYNTSVLTARFREKNLNKDKAVVPEDTVDPTSDRGYWSYSLTLSSNSDICAVKSYLNNRVIFYRYGTGKFKKLFEKKFNRLEQASAFSPDDKFFVVGDQDKIQIVDMSSQEIIFTKAVPEGIKQIFFINNSEILYTNLGPDHDDDVKLHFLSPQKLREIYGAVDEQNKDIESVICFDSKIKNIALSPDRREYAVGLENGQILRYRKKLLHEMEDIE